MTTWSSDLNIMDHHQSRSPTSSYKVIIRDIEFLTRVGVHAVEEKHPQLVRLNITLLASRGGGGLGVVDYSTVADGIRALAKRRHVRLVEELAEEVAAFCLAGQRVTDVAVRVEKLRAIEGAASAGVEVHRRAQG